MSRPRMLVRCVCSCGAVEMHYGCNASFQCVACKRPSARDTQKRAQRAVQQAVRSGEIPPASDLPCADCGAPSVDYDHRDYSKPLQVDPVCRSCNLKRGPAVGHTTWKNELAALCAAGA
jgi:hypothetical protein